MCCLAVAGLVEIADHVGTIHSHLPTEVAMHGQEFIFSILVCLCVYLLATHTDGESEESKDGHTAPVTSTGWIATANPSATGGNASSKIADTIILGATPLPAPAPIPQPPKKRALYISPIKVRITWVNEGGRYGNVFYEPEERDELSSVKAITADFRNIPQDDFSVTNWHNIKSSIFYYDANESEVAEVSEGHWLEHAAIKISLARHKTERVIVAIRAKDAWISFDGGDTTKLPDGIKSAKIVLHDDRGEFELSFSLQMDLDVPMVCCLEAIKPQ
jgi:hypothetical protein